MITKVDKDKENLASTPVAPQSMQGTAQTTL